LSSFQEIQNKILNHFSGNDDELRTEVKNAINDVIAEINDTVPKAQHLEKTTTFTTTVGDSALTGVPSSDQSRILNIQLQNSEGKDFNPLIWLPWNEWRIRKLYDIGNGCPAYYSEFDGVIHIGPPSSAAYTGRLDYYALDAEMTANSDIRSLTEHYIRWERLIILGGKSRIYDYLGHDGQMIQKSDRDFNKGLDQFRRWVRLDFNRSPEGSIIKNWKQIKLRRPITPWPFSRGT